MHKYIQCSFASVAKCILSPPLSAFLSLSHVHYKYYLHLCCLLMKCLWPTAIISGHILPGTIVCLYMCFVYAYAFIRLILIYVKVSACCSLTIQYLTSGSLPSDTRLRALQPSEPIHEKAPVALLRRTARITSRTS